MRRRTDLTAVRLPLGAVVEVTETDCGTRKRITGTVMGYTRAPWRYRFTFRSGFRRVIDGVWVGDVWVSLATSLSSATRVLPDGQVSEELAAAGEPIALADAVVGDVLFVAFPHGDAIVQGLGPVDIIDEEGAWVGLDGEMCLGSNVPYFTLRRVTASTRLEQAAS